MATRRKPTGTRTGNHRNQRRAGNTNAAPTGGAATFLGAISEQTELMYTAAKNASDRAQRLSQAALDDVQSTQRDLIRLWQQWAESPFDLLGWYTGVVETAVSARGRVAQSFSRWRHELSQARGEAAATFQRSIQAGWQANKAGLGVARDLLVQRNGAS